MKKGNPGFSANEEMGVGETEQQRNKRCENGCDAPSGGEGRNGGERGYNKPLKPGFPISKPRGGFPIVKPEPGPDGHKPAPGGTPRRNSGPNVGFPISKPQPGGSGVTCNCQCDGLPLF